MDVSIATYNVMAGVVDLRARAGDRGDIAFGTVRTAGRVAVSVRRRRDAYCMDQRWEVLRSPWGEDVVYAMLYVRPAIISGRIQ